MFRKSAKVFRSCSLTESQNVHVFCSPKAKLDVLSDIKTQETPLDGSVLSLAIGFHYWPVINVAAR
jgi:hypothetical protein